MRSIVDFISSTGDRSRRRIRDASSDAEAQVVSLVVAMPLVYWSSDGWGYTWRPGRSGGRHRVHRHGARGGFAPARDPGPRGRRLEQRQGRRTRPRRRAACGIQVDGGDARRRPRRRRSHHVSEPPSSRPRQGGAHRGQARGLRKATRHDLKRVRRAPPPGRVEQAGPRCWFPTSASTPSASICTSWSPRAGWARCVW